MTDNSFTSPMSMVKIDGAKIKLLRERQGLTQLYLATAVEVTTDTISRWENRRYPGIKRENGLKLAEALNVQLEDILEQVPDQQLPLESAEAEGSPPVDQRATERPALWTTRRLALLLGAAICLVVAFSWYFLHSSSSGPFVVQRIVPSHCISGQPFPVLIKVSGAPDENTALIIKENLPENVTIRATSPKIPAANLKGNQIKWLKKINDTALFAYLLSVSGKEQETIRFSGTASVGGTAESPVSGNDAIVIGNYHWADTNMDNVISDSEILAVYDKYSGITEIDLDIDLIEEIWMGSEYRWDPAKASIKIID